MTIRTPTRPKQGTGSAIDPESLLAIRDYVRTHAWHYGSKRTAEALGVSRQTLWRFLKRPQLGRAIPHAVLESVGTHT